MNTEIKKMEKCDICKRTIRSEMSQYLRFVKAFLADVNVTRATNVLLPFDDDVRECLHFYGNNSLVKGMGVSLMRMELHPSIFSFGVVLELADSEFCKGGNKVSYVYACKSFDEIKKWVDTEDFKSQAENAFDAIIDSYFFE